MKTYLMYPDQDFNPQQEPPWNERELIQDLELSTLFKTMSSGDEFLLNVIRRAVLNSQVDLDVIAYRQAVLKDCIHHSATIREMYALTVNAIAKEKEEYWGIFGKYPPATLSRAVKVMRIFIEALKRLRSVADEQGETFASSGFTRFFSMLRQELSDEYFAEMEGHLLELQSHDTVLISAELGKGNIGTNYVLHNMQQKKRSWIERFINFESSEYTIVISNQDNAGATALSELRDRGINLVANALAQSCDHILSFFNMLQTELAFYMACLNLYDQLLLQGEPVCFPVPTPADERALTCSGLYDVCLALDLKQKVASNDLDANGKCLFIITGANQGGKSTFLRSIGVSQLMMQCGMFVPAESFHANIGSQLLTHYRRKEDATMKSGKLDEELSRMNKIVDHLTDNSILLLNESFAATNEREGSEIARQILSALLKKRIKVFFVTHLFEFAHDLYEKNLPDVTFLRAERKTGGKRTFRLAKGEPLQTSFGEDLYDNVFIKGDSNR